MAVAPARAGADLAELRAQQMAAGSPAEAGSAEALQVAVFMFEAEDAEEELTCGEQSDRVSGPFPLKEVLVAAYDRTPFLSYATKVWLPEKCASRAVLLVDVLNGTTALPGLAALVPACTDDMLPWCGPIHLAALVYLCADAFGNAGEYEALLDNVARPHTISNLCCLRRRALDYMSRAGGHRVVKTVVAGGLEFAADTLRDYSECTAAVAAAVDYLALAAGDGRERRAAATGVLPHLIAFVKDLARSEDAAEASGPQRSNDDAKWKSGIQALIYLAGCCHYGAPHPVGGLASTPQPQVVEEMVHSGCPRLYLSRAVALAQRMHKLSAQPELDGQYDWLKAHLRQVGHVFRACVLYASTPRNRDTRLLKTVVAAMRANAQVCHLQLWALRYCFVPLAYAEITRKKVGAGPAFVRAGHAACRLACCAPRRSMGNAPETLAALNAVGALPVIIAAAEQHIRCRRSAARLLAYLAQGDASARRSLEEHGAAATMLRIHADEEPRFLHCKLFEVYTPWMEKAMGNFALPRLQEAYKAQYCIDNDAVEPASVDADGRSLSECDMDDDIVFLFAKGYAPASPEAVFDSTQNACSWYSSRMKLMTLAVCALTGAPDVDQAATMRSAAAADDCAAALLAEEEAEKAAKAAAASKKKNKKNKKKAKAAADAAEASDEEEEEEEKAEELGVKALAAGVMRATLAPPPQPFRSPAAAAAAQPPPPPPAKQKKAGKAKQSAAQPAPASKPPPPHVVAHAKEPPSLPPVAHAPLPPPPPPPPQAQAAPSLPPLPIAVPRAVLAEPLARAPSVDELFPWLAVRDSPPSEPAGPLADAAHEDDALCLVCLDAERDTPLPGCADAHPPVLCAACVAWLRRSNAPACPLCRAPLA